MTDSEHFWQLKKLQKSALAGTEISVPSQGFPKNLASSTSVIASMSDISDTNK
jgi:hypothetical protein